MVKRIESSVVNLRLMPDDFKDKRPPPEISSPGYGPYVNSRDVEQEMERRENICRNLQGEFASECPDGLVLEGDQAAERLVKMRDAFSANDGMGRWAGVILHPPFYTPCISAMTGRWWPGPPCKYMSEEVKKRKEEVRKDKPRRLANAKALIHFFQLQRQWSHAAPITHKPEPIPYTQAAASVDGVSIHVDGTLEHAGVCGDESRRSAVMYFSAEVGAAELDGDGFVAEAVGVAAIIQGTRFPKTASCEQVADLAARALVRRLPAIEWALVRVRPHGQTGRYAQSRRSRPGPEMYPAIDLGPAAAQPSREAAKS